VVLQLLWRVRGKELWHGCYEWELILTLGVRTIEQMGADAYFGATKYREDAYLATFSALFGLRGIRGLVASKDPRRCRTAVQRWAGIVVPLASSCAWYIPVDEQRVRIRVRVSASCWHEVIADAASYLLALPNTMGLVGDKYRASPMWLFLGVDYAW